MVNAIISAPLNLCTSNINPIGNHIHISQVILLFYYLAKTLAPIFLFYMYLKFLYFSYKLTNIRNKTQNVTHVLHMLSGDLVGQADSMITPPATHLI